MKLAKVLTSRYAIAAINAVIFIITAATIYRAIQLCRNLVNDFNEIEELLDGLGIIFVAYGVALEERDTIMRFFGLYPGMLNETEEATDRLCHFYGLCFLLTGLFMEVVVEVVKFPNLILNTKGIEGVVFSVGFLFCAIAGIALVRHAYLLIRLELQRK